MNIARSKFSCVGALLFGLLSCGQIYAEEEVSEADIKRLQVEISGLQDELNEFQGQQSKLQTALRESEIALGNIATEIANIESQLSRHDATLTSLQQRRRQLMQLKAEQQEYISQQIITAYQLGRQKKLKLLLNQEEPTRLSRAITYLDYFNQARLQYLRDYVETIVEIDRVEPQILEQTAKLEQSQTDLKQRSRAQAAERSKREQALATIALLIRGKDYEISSLQQERDRLEKLLKAVEEAVANLQLPAEYRAFSERQGQMEWPAAGRQGNRFNTKKGSSGLIWQGIELLAEEGAPVRSIHNGRVVYADWFRGQGLLLIIDHGDGYMSLYGHNKSMLRQVGDWVAVGEPIATVGRSGGQPSASLYFEVRKDGKPQDPRRWCKK